MHLLIKTNDIILEGYYGDHTHYHEGDSGLDLFCPQDIVVKAGQIEKIDLKIQCEALKDGSNVSYYLYPRSSIVKTPLRLSNSVGIIDAGYRGNIMAFVDNIKDYDYIIEQGTRLFQICSGDLSPLTFTLTNSLSETSRGNGSFGSTNRLRRHNTIDYEPEPEPQPQ